MKPTCLPQGNLTVWGGRLTLKLQQITSVRWFDAAVASVYMSDGKEYEIDEEDYRALKNSLRAGESR